MNCSVVPAAMLGIAGVTAIDTSVAGVTVRVTAGEVIPLSDAVTEEFPGTSVVARPRAVVELLIDITAEFEDIHDTRVVRSCVELSV
jgi:hypothetical protein